MRLNECYHWCMHVPDRLRIHIVWLQIMQYNLPLSFYFFSLSPLSVSLPSPFSLSTHTHTHSHTLSLCVCICVWFSLFDLFLVHSSHSPPPSVPKTRDCSSYFLKGWSTSESEVRSSIKNLFQSLHFPGSLAVTCFSSNVARIQSVLYAAAETNRRVSDPCQRVVGLCIPWSFPIFVGATLWPHLHPDSFQPIIIRSKMIINLYKKSFNLFRGF